MKKKVKKFINIVRDSTIITEITNLLAEQPSSPPVRFTNTPIVSTTDDDINYFKNNYEIEQNDNHEIIDDDILTIPNINENININKILTDESKKSYCDYSILKRLTISSLVATGTGLAMMPVFNNLVKNSDQFGIDIHNNKIVFDISTANTFIISSVSSFVTLNEFIKKHQQQKLDNDSLKIALSKTCASFSLILPLGLLWVTEIDNQKVTESSGFDQFIAWATFTTLPLIVSQTLESITNVNKVLEAKNLEMINLNDNEVVNPISIGSKIVIYGLATTSIIGRSIAFTEICKALSLASGVSEEVALGVGIALGGILTSSGVSVLEYNNVKILFETPSGNYTLKKAVLGTVALAEGVWFTLPLVSLGLSATNSYGWDSLIKGALFIPLLASHSVLESTRIYDNVSSICDYISDGFSSFKEWCCNDEVSVSGEDYYYT